MSERYINNLTGDFSICFSEHLTEHPTNLIVTSCRFLFSLPNTYLYSGLNVPTLDLFFECKVADTSQLKAMDDAAECMWLEPKDINPEDFGLKSISEGIKKVFNCQSIT